MSAAKNNTRHMGGPGGRGPGGPGMMPVEKAKDFKGSLKKLFAYIKPFRAIIIVVAIAAVCSTVFAIIGPKIMAKATDALATGISAIVTGTGEGIDFAYIGKVLLITLGLYVISALFNYLQSYILAGVSSKVSYNLRTNIEHKINRLPLGYFHSTTQGDILSRITNDVDVISQSLGSNITQIISSAVTIVGVLAMMISISPLMTLIAIVSLPVSLLSVTAIVKRSQKQFKDQQNYLGEVNGQIEEMYGGHTVIKAFGAEERSIEAFNKKNDKLYTATWKAQFLSGMMQPITGFIGNLCYVVVCIVGAALTAGGRMTIGGIQAFITYVRNFNQPITQVANISNQIQQTVAAAERVFEFLDAEEMSVIEPKVTVNVGDGKDTEGGIEIEGNIVFDHVKFGYDEENIVIKDFCADVKSGQKIAIVGPTGAGKTTLVKLIMRFHDILGGDIYIDGHDIDEFTREDLRREFGMVLQDTWLFNGTIMDNIRYGRLNATDEEVIAAAKAAQIDKFIRTLPDGYNMVLNEEATNISQGQKQLLTIARAILANSRVLILDEATSSVDTRTEILIQKAMDNLTAGRTSFVIAHRLSTIRNADLILCMVEGDIVEQGTHDELIAKNGFYANLYNSQFERISA